LAAVANGPTVAFLVAAEGVSIGDLHAPNKPLRARARDLRGKK
jgi:hypothetical protein